MNFRITAEDGGSSSLKTLKTTEIWKIHDDNETENSILTKTSLKTKVPTQKPRATADIHSSVRLEVVV